MLVERKGNSLPINTMVKLVGALIVAALIGWVVFSGSLTKSAPAYSTLSDLTGGLTR